MRIEFTPDAELFPFRSRFFESSAGRVHYVDEGAGRPILLLHGNPTWSFLYRKIVPLLSDGFRCIAVDYPGFGLSDRPEGYGYTPDEHARVIGELVDHLDLDGFLLMVQDWGGPIGFAVAIERADRVRGIVHGNTWFWPVDTFMFKLFPRVMSTRYMQRQILEKNFFVERIMPRATVQKLSQAEMDHYRKAQPTPEARVGVAEFPRQILKAEPLLARLEQDVPRLLGAKPVVFVWGDEGPCLQTQAGPPPGPCRVLGPRGRRAAQRVALHPGGRAPGDRTSDTCTLRSVGGLGAREIRRRRRAPVAVDQRPQG